MSLRACDGADFQRRSAGFRVAATTLDAFFACLIGLLGVQHLDTPSVIAVIGGTCALLKQGVAFSITSNDFKLVAPVLVLKTLDFPAGDLGTCR